MSSKDSGVGFAAGLIMGAVIGIAVGLLYAPRSGEETREMLQEKAEMLKHRAEILKAQATETIEKARIAANEAAQKVQDKL